MSIQAAMALANELELDLVEISPKADPPVCKIIDYKKFLYAQKKKQNTTEIVCVIIQVDTQGQLI